MAQDESITFRLTVYCGAASSTEEKTVLVPAKLLAAGQPFSFRTRLAPGVHEIEGIVVRSPGAPGLVRLDLDGTSTLREGSLSVVQGNVVIAGPREIALRVGSSAEERFRVRFELE